MKFISWNVNGLRACVNKGFLDAFHSLDADFFCLQETKLQEGQINLDLPGYYQYWCYAEKKGYSGTAIFAKYQPLNVTYGIGIPELDTEGRVICLEYPEFFLVTCYTPNAQRGLARIDHRLHWETAFRDYLKNLDQQKPVILCGDLNVAHKEIDLKNPNSNRGNAGFSDQEREAFSLLLDSGFTDTFRHQYPDKTGAYSWWSYMFNARANNAGWRIDYFLVSDRLASNIYDATIHPDILGSDHCPVGLDLDTTCNGSLPISTPSFNSQTDSPKGADVESPIGSFRTLITAGLLLILVLLLCIPVTLLLTAKTPQPESIPTTLPAQNPLIHNIIDRTGTINFRLESSPWNSSVPNGILHTDTEQWSLYNADSQILDLQNMTFCIQLVFDPDEHYTLDNLPEIVAIDNNIAFSSSFVESNLNYCYYWENDRISGCFIFGRSLKPALISVIASDKQRTQRTDPIPVDPIFNMPLFREITNYPATIQLETNFFTSSWFHTHSLRDDTNVWYTIGFYNGWDSLTWSPNFFIQIEFPEVDFTKDNHPQVDINRVPDYLAPVAEDFYYEVVYYHTDGYRIKGAFILGYASYKLSRTISVSYTDYNGTQMLYGGNIIIEPDFASMTTKNLAYSLRYSKEIYLPMEQESQLIQTMENSPALQELLQRPDAIDAILEVIGESTSTTRFEALLQTDYVQSLMTDEQKSDYLKRIKLDDVSYPPINTPG